MLRKNKNILILAGGGARGRIQTGMLLALRDAGLDFNNFEIVLGASVGALNGSLLVQGELDKLKELWLKVNNNNVYSVNIFNTFGKSASIFSSDPLKNLLKQNLNLSLAKASSINFYVQATNLNLWNTTRFLINSLESNQEYVDILLASASAPIGLPVAQYKGQSFCDGGILDNFSVADAMELEGKNVLLLSPTYPKKQPPKNILEMLDIMLSLPEYGYLHQELKLINLLKDKIHVDYIAPTYDSGVGLLDFSASKEEKLIQLQIGRSIINKALLNKTLDLSIYI